MKKVAFIGYGELGKQIHALAKHIYKEVEAIVFDDVCFANGSEAEGIKTFYPFSEFKEEQFKVYSFFICLGYKHLQTKNEIIIWLLNHNYDLPSLIHSSAFINPSACLGKAVYIYPMSNIDKGVYIGHGVLVNNSVVISHDTNIGNCSYLSPGVVTSGLVNVNECTFIGSGAILSNGVSIGKNSIVGIGTVVTKDIPENSSVVGNPFKLLKNTLKLI